MHWIVSDIIDLLKRTLPRGGHFIVGAFSKESPEKCGGLPVQQHDEYSMSELLVGGFEHLQSLDHLHTTPATKQQHFYFGTFKKSRIAPSIHPASWCEP